MSFLMISWVLLMHWLFDFALQSDKMAINKSNKFEWLFTHSLVYSLMAFTLGLPNAIAGMFYLYLLITHGLIDGVTSRVTSYLWKKEERHWFFVVIGFDQWLHFVTIFWFLSSFANEIN